MIQPNLEQELREAFVHSSVGNSHLNALCRVDLMDKNLSVDDTLKAAKGVLAALDGKIAQVQSGHEPSLFAKTKLALLGHVRDTYIFQVNGAFKEFGVDASIGEAGAKGRF